MEREDVVGNSVSMLWRLEGVANIRGDALSQRTHILEMQPMQQCLLDADAFICLFVMAGPRLFQKL